MGCGASSDYDNTAAGGQPQPVYYQTGQVVLVAPPQGGGYPNGAQPQQQQQVVYVTQTIPVQQQPVQQQQQPVQQPIAQPASSKVAPVEAEVPKQASAPAAMPMTPNMKLHFHEHEFRHMEWAAFHKKHPDVGTFCYVCNYPLHKDVAVYNCKEEKCYFPIHPQCFFSAGGVDPVSAHMEDNFIIPSHPHPLQWFETRYDGNWFCDLDKGQGGGGAYSCNECGFDVHYQCFFHRGGRDRSKKDLCASMQDRGLIERRVKEMQQRADAARERELKIEKERKANAERDQFVPGVPAPAYDNQQKSLFPSHPFVFPLGVEAENVIRQLKPAATPYELSLLKGADVHYNLVEKAFPEAGGGGLTPQKFFQDWKKVVFLDLNRLGAWKFSETIDESMNAIIWHAIFQAAAQAAKEGTNQAWETLKAKGIYCCSVDEIPTSRSIFVTHRWSVKGGIAQMSPSFFQNYTMYCCGVNNSKKEANGQLTPIWCWLDLLCVPQNTPRPEFDTHSFTYSAQEKQLRHDCNMHYMAYVGLQFGVIAAKCEFFWHHQPLFTLFDRYVNKLTRQVSEVKYDSQGEWFSRWGCSSSLLLFEDRNAAVKAGMSTVETMKIYQTAARMEFDQLFYTDLSYNSRIWCLAEFALRVFSKSDVNFKDCRMFFHEMWQLHGPKDFAPRHNGHVIAANSGSATVLQALQILSQWQLMPEYVMAFVAGCTAIPAPFPASNEPGKWKQMQFLGSLLSLEGIFSVVANATATNTRDIPLVIHTLYSTVCSAVYGLPSGSPVPPAIEALLQVCFICGRCGKTANWKDVASEKEASEEAKNDWKKVQQTFYDFFDPAKGQLKAYLDVIKPKFKQGTNSLFLLDRILSTLLVNGKPLSYDAAAINTVPVTPVDVKVPAPPAGYEHGPVVSWYLSEKVGGGAQVSDYFTNADNGMKSEEVTYKEEMIFSYFGHENPEDHAKNLSRLSHRARFPRSLNYMGEWGNQLIAGEKGRWCVPPNGGWKSAQPDFPATGFPQSEWLFPLEEEQDPLHCFQPLSPVLGACPFRAAYGVATRQASVKEFFHKGYFFTEHIYLQLNGSIRGITVDQIKQWWQLQLSESYVTAWKANGSRSITSTKVKIPWDPTNKYHADPSKIPFY